MFIKTADAFLDIYEYDILRVACSVLFHNSSCNVCF